MQGTVLITGASTGIGYEMAPRFAARGYDVVVVARTRDRLEALAATKTKTHGVVATPIAADLATADGVDLVLGELGRQGRTVDVLVNNAGFGLAGPFVETDAAAELDMIAVNITALTRLTKAFLPSMVHRRRGRILNVASTAAFLPGPYMAVYYASKAYVLSFSEALTEELRGSGVTVTALCPGPTATAFSERAGTESTQLFRRAALMDAGAVAEAGVAGALAGKRLVIPGAINKALPQVLRMAPRRMAAAIAAGLNRKRTG